MKNNSLINKFLVFSLIFSLITLFLIYNNSISIVVAEDKKEAVSVQNKENKEHQVSTESKQKMEHKHMVYPKIEHKIKDIEKNQEFWNYLKTSHPDTFNLLQSIKNKYPKIYAKLLMISEKMFVQINKTSNQDLKNIFADQINNQTKLTKLIVDHKENKIKEEEFDKQAKEILRNIHTNNIKIMEIKIQELKDKTESKVEEMLQRIKEEIKGK